MAVEREMSRFLSGRWDRFGGYVRFWFDGPGIFWRTGLSPSRGDGIRVGLLRSNR